MEKKNYGSEYFGIGSVSISHCDRYMAYSLDLKGSEYYTIYLRDLDSNKNEKDIIENTSGGITWSLDSKSFFYSKLDKFHRPRQIFKHIIGTTVKEDKLIFEEKDETFTCSISLTSDENFFVISTSDHITTEEHFFPSNTNEIKPVLFQKRVKDVRYSIDSWKGFFYVHTNEDARDYKIGELHIQDDSLTANKKNLYSLCDALEKLGLPWCTPNGTKVNYHFKKHDEMYKKMHDSGCYQITLACESGVQRVLDDVINKRLPLETIYPSIEQAKAAGMLVHTYWILGYPGETFEEMQQTIDFAMNSGADSFTFSILSPLPGTPIYRQVVNENLWWSGRGLDDVILQRESLIKVDGFNSPYDFESFVRETNKKANLLLQQNNPERFKYKYGADADETSLIKQS